MKAKDFKEIISKIPDNHELIFRYSGFEFENVCKLVNGEDVLRYFPRYMRDEFPNYKKMWMIDFDN